MEEFVNAYWSGHNVVLLRRDEQRQLVERRIPAEYSFFVRLADFPKIEAECRIQIGRRRIRRVSKEGEFVRIVCDSPEFRYLLCHGRDGNPAYLDQEGLEIQSYEADLHPVRRFLIDSHCKIQKPVKAWLDIETDDRVPFSRAGEGRILVWSVTHETGERVVGVLEEDSDQAEEEFLKDLFHELQSVDCILAWNGDRFDFPVIKKRLSEKFLNVPINLKRWLLLDAMECFRKYNMHSAESGDEKDSVALERVAASLGIDVTDKLRSLNETGKLKSWELWVAGGYKRELLVNRCIFDAWSMWQIEQKTRYVDLHYAVCATSGCFPDSRGLSALVHVESFLMRLADKKQLRFKSMWGQSKEEERDKKTKRFKGAFVLPVTPGISRNVHVCDFSGMYPSIIQSWNMSPETWRPEHSGRDDETLEDVIRRLPEGHSVCPNTLQVFVNEPQGILSTAVDELKTMRKKYNKIRENSVPQSPEWLDAERLSQGAKIGVNSCFGVVASSYSRVFVKEVGESITLGGQYLIKETIKLGEERGIRPIAGDTDSVFAIGVGEQAFREFVGVCNKVLYPTILKSLGCVRNEIELDYEKEFDLLIFGDAKKRYAGRFRHYKGKHLKSDSMPVIKGFEYRRGDSLRLTRHFQKLVIERLLLLGEDIPAVYPLKPEDFHETIEEWKLRVTTGELEKRDLVISKSLSKDVDDYEVKKSTTGKDVTQPIHIQIAKILEQRGENVTEGTRIEYVVVGEDPLRAVPVSDFEIGQEDRSYYWLKCVWPPVERILKACWPEYRWDRYRELDDRGGGKGRSAYRPGQKHFDFFWK